MVIKYPSKNIFPLIAHINNYLSANVLMHKKSRKRPAQNNVVRGSTEQRKV